MKRILVLFPKEWDKPELERSACGEYEFVFAGFDLFRFPGNAQLFTFDVRRFIDRLAARFRRERIDGIFSNNEYFGALTAAVLAERLGLPGTPPAALINAQHKYYARLAQQKLAPEAVPRFAVFPYTCREPEKLGLPYPFFVKPVRATFSVLARRIRNAEEFRTHLRFSALETLIIKRLVKPFNDLMPHYTDHAIDAHHFIAEEPLTGVQVNIDGFARNGEIRFIGLADALLFPGTDAFLRFEYPSQVPADVRERMHELAARVLKGMGYTHGFFNVEVYWQPDTGEIRIIEINPRLASQLAGLYRRVEGYKPHRMLLELATGQEPSFEREPTGCTHAASFVFRKFDGTPLKSEPTPERVRQVQARYPDADVMLYLKRGASLAREMKWLGSYRYALLNLSGASEEDLFRRYREIRGMLAFDESDAPFHAARAQHTYGLIGP